MAKTKKLDNKSPAEVSTEIKKKLAKDQEDNKDELRVDPTVENKEAEKAAEVAEEQKKAKAKADKELAKKAKVHEGIEVETSAVTKDTVIKESSALKKAVKADAKERGKEYTECLLTGVLVVR